MSEAQRKMTDEELAEMQAKSRQQYQQRIEAISHHVIGILAVTGASAHAISMIGSYLVGAGIDQLSKEDKSIAERVAKDLAAGFVQVINNLDLQPEAETEKAD
jgi:hypothetical protein